LLCGDGWYQLQQAAILVRSVEEGAINHKPCLLCGAELAPTATSCMECGQLLVPIPICEEGGTSVCGRPDCRHRSAPAARFCERCAYPLPLQSGAEVTGRYRIRRHLYSDGGFGGYSFGPIYLGTDRLNNGASVVLREFTCSDRDLFRAGLPFFRAAYEKLQILQASPLVPAAVDFVEAQGAAYMVVEYLPGPSLGKLLAGATVLPFPLEQVVEWGKGLCELLDLMHAQHPPLLKREFGAEDLLLDRSGNLKVVNFGLAWRTPLYWRPLRVRVY